MNPDKLVGRQLSASSSNRNFKGRQGSSSGRTLLMSPVMVIAAAVTGKVTDVRELMNKNSNNRSVNMRSNRSIVAGGVGRVCSIVIGTNRDLLA